jgi:methyl-accepting chemotaxis protein
MTVNTIKDQYYKKLGKIMLGLSLGHIPLFVLTAALFNTEYSIALGLASFFIIPQLIAYYKTPHSPLSLYLFSFIIMCFSGILIHLGKGMIEMHFHVFVFIPITAIFGLYWAPIIAAVTIAIHHIGFFFLLPESIFNYEASFSIVILHATFVIVETAIAIFVCKKFKDFLEKEEYVNSKLSLIGASYGKEGKSIKTMADRISEQSQRQIEFTQKTSSAATEISALSKTNLEHVSNSVQIVQDSNEKIKSGNKVIKSAIEANDNINNQFKSIMDAFSGINSSFQEVNSLMHEISEKTGIINDIVFQTKLLSFNASVEAARAC